MKKILMLSLVAAMAVQSSFAGAPVNIAKPAIVNVSTTEVAVVTPVTSLEEKPTKQTRKEKKELRKQIRKQIRKSSGDNWVTALLLSFFLGSLGIDRLYLGYSPMWILKLLTLGGLGIWALIDFIRIIIKDLKPKGGDYAA